MATVGSFEAKTHLSALLDRVAKGERITITKHGVPVAVLIPPISEQAADRHRDIETLRLLGTCTAIVPSVWPLEVANSLVNAERRGRLQPARTAELIAEIA